MKHLIAIITIYFVVCLFLFLHINGTPVLTVRVNEPLDIKSSILVIATQNLKFKRPFDHAKYVQIHKNSFELSERNWSNSCYCFEDVANNWQEEIFSNEVKMTLHQREAQWPDDIEKFDNFFSRNIEKPLEIAKKLKEGNLDNFYLETNGYKSNYSDEDKFKNNQYKFKYIALITNWYDTLEIKVYDIEDLNNIKLKKDVSFNGRMAFYYNSEESASRDLEETFKRFSILTYFGNNPNPLFDIFKENKI